MTLLHNVAVAPLDEEHATVKQCQCAVAENAATFRPKAHVACTPVELIPREFGQQILTGDLLFRHDRVVAQVGYAVQPLVQRHPIQVENSAVVCAGVVHGSGVIKLLDPGGRVVSIAETTQPGQEVEEAAHPVANPQNQDRKLEGSDVADVDVHHELPGSEELVQFADPTRDQHRQVL